MTHTFSSFSSKKEYAKAPAGIYAILGNDYSPVIFKKGESSQSKSWQEMKNLLAYLSQLALFHYQRLQRN